MYANNMAAMTHLYVLSRRQHRDAFDNSVAMTYTEKRILIN